MLRNAADAEGLYQAVMGTVTSDAGLMMDRARYLRASNYEQAARDLAARPHNFVYRPADPARFYDMLLLLANDAAQDRQWETVLNITHHLSDALPPGTDLTRQPIDLRDKYTSLAWLGGSVALTGSSGRRAPSRCTRLMLAAVARSRSRPRAIIGPAVQRWPPGVSRTRTPISSSAAAYPGVVLRPARARAAGQVRRLRRPRRFPNM